MIPENRHRAYCHLIDSHRHRSIHTRVVHEGRLRPQRWLLCSRLPNWFVDFPTKMIWVPARGLCPFVQKERPLPGRGLLRSVEATNSFSQAERIVVMNSIQGAEMSNQDVLERCRFTHVDVFWSGTCNTTGRTHRERIGVGPKMGRFHLQSDN